jgi:hypothetical protein
MAKLIFKYTDDLLEDCREASEIEFKIPDDMDIHEFKIICVRLASAMGYSQTSIEKSFGDLVFGDEKDEELKQLLHDITSRGNNKKSK